MPHLHLLGTPRIEDDHGPLTGAVAQRHRLALLALLALTPERTVARDTLVAMLWPEADAASGRNRLNVALHAIRSALGREVVRSEGDAVVLDDRAIEVDTCAFEAALDRGAHDEAVQLYDRPLLEGFHLDSAEFDHWADRERERLSGLHHAALEALAEEAAERDDHAGAAAWWRRRAAAEPFSARVTVRLMEALELAGERAEAIRAADRHARVLRDELDAPPNPDVEEVARRLRTEPRPVLTRLGPTPPSSAPRASTAVPPPPRRFRHLRRAVVATAGFAVLVTLVASRLLDSARPLAPIDRTVAVLPFRALGPDSSHAFERALHSEVMRRLTHVVELTVLSESAARSILEEAAPADEPTRPIARWLVRGDIQQIGHRVRIGVRLLDTRDDRQVWADHYDVELSADDMFRTQAEVARRIAEALEVRLTPGERRRLAAVPTANTNAYELYLQGLALDRVRPLSGDNIVRRIALLRQALELDPDFADGWAALADAYVDRAWSTGDRDTFGDSAIAAARRALEIDPEQAYAWTQLGDAWGLRTAGRGDPLEAYRKALSLQPSNFEAANNYVAHLRLRGHLAEAIRWSERAHRLSPRTVQHVSSLVYLNSLAGRDAVAGAWLLHGRAEGHDLVLIESRIELYHRGRLERVEELLPALERVRQTDVARRIAPALALYRRDWAAARDLYGVLNPVAPGSSMSRFHGLFYDRLGLAYALLHTGEPDEARRLARTVIEEARRPIADGSVDLAYWLSMVGAHIVLGDRTAALDWLEEAVDRGYRDGRTLRGAPVLDEIRDLPRFDEIVTRIEQLVAAEREALDGPGGEVVPSPAGQ